jgi:hypothetical protein
MERIAKKAILMNNTQKSARILVFVCAVPDYARALQTHNRKKLVRALSEMGGEASFGDLKSAVGFGGNTLVHNLEVLKRLGVIENPVKGVYRLRFKTPLLFLFCTKRVKTFYLGLLGKKDSRKEAEPQVALSLLENEGFSFDDAYVVTSLDALNDWNSLSFHWIVLGKIGEIEEISDIESVKRKVEKELVKLLESGVVVMDCTSATKPATIAFYELAQKYLVPLIYVYEPQKRLTWLLSKESISSRLFKA